MKIILDEETELTEREEAIYKKGKTEGHNDGTQSTALVFSGLILLALIILFFFSR